MVGTRLWVVLRRVALRGAPQIPEEHHGNNWHEKWGESWDGKGGAAKFTDRWAERYADGTQGNRKWGEKWNQGFGAHTPPPHRRRRDLLV